MNDKSIESDMNADENSLIIACPSCYTKFALDRNQIEASSDAPQFHCSRCDHVFSLDTAITEEPPANTTFTNTTGADTGDVFDYDQINDKPATEVVGEKPSPPAGAYNSRIKQPDELDPLSVTTEVTPVDASMLGEDVDSDLGDWSFDDDEHLNDSTHSSSAQGEDTPFIDSTALTHEPIDNTGLSEQTAQTEDAARLTGEQIPADPVQLEADLGDTQKIIPEEVNTRATIEISPAAFGVEATEEIAQQSVAAGIIDDVEPSNERSILSNLTDPSSENPTPDLPQGATLEQLRAAEVAFDSAFSDAAAESTHDNSTSEGLIPDDPAALTGPTTDQVPQQPAPIPTGAPVQESLLDGISAALSEPDKEELSGLARPVEGTVTFEELAMGAAGTGAAPQSSSFKDLVYIAAPLVLFLALLGAAAVTLLQSDSLSRNFASLGGSLPQVAPPGLRLEDTSFKAVELHSGDMVWLISGKIANHTDSAFQNILVEGHVFDSEGNPVRSVKTAASNEIAKSKLELLSVDFINRLQGESSSRGMRIEPGQEKRFAIAVPDGSEREASFYSARIFSVS